MSIFGGVGGGTTAAATTSVAGIVELANTAETAAGIDSTRAVTPAGLAGAGITTFSLTVPVSESLGSGNLVNLWNAGGVLKARKAKASLSLMSNGYVLGAVTFPGNAVIYTSLINNQVSGLTIGGVCYLGEGTVTSTAPTASGYLRQEVGVAVSATNLLFLLGESIILA